MEQTIQFDAGILDRFLDALRSEDRSAATVQKYARDLNGLLDYMSREGLDGLSKDVLVGYKRHIAGTRAPSSVNAALSAVNKLASFLGHPELKLPFVRIQHRAFRDAGRDLTRKDYDRLVDTAYARGQERLGLVLETLGSAGLRISELKFVTVEAVRRGQAEIDMKSKVRVVMLPKKLCRKLLAWCGSAGISGGPVFLTRTGRTLTRQEIWREMKTLCAHAGIPESKVYPHNFRHMFATAFYGECKDIVKLADVLGHSNVNTTRIYLISSGREHARQLDKLGLVR